MSDTKNNDPIIEDVTDDIEVVNTNNLNNLNPNNTNNLNNPNVVNQNINRDNKENKIDSNNTKIDKSKDESVLIATQSILSILNRNDKRKDPVTRQLLFVDKILSVLDIIVSMYIFNSNDLSENTKAEVKQVANMIRNKFEELEEHIEQPYSLNHPYGLQMMKEAGEHFASSASKFKSLD